MPPEVRVVFRKYDGSLHWHFTVRLLGDDGYGVWVGAPAGGVTRKGDGPRIPIAHAHVGLLPRRAGWTAWFYADPDEIEIYCDVTTVPVWQAGNEVTVVDLDLDVCRTRSGSVELLDEDEFAEHRVRYRYPEPIIEAATRTAGWLQTALGDGTEPFVGEYRRWLALIT